MALIKCNNCGRSVSDRATVCPHCGCDPHATKEANTDNNSEKEQNPNLTTCPHCGSLVSKKATVCPKCGKSMISVFHQTQDTNEHGSDIDEYDDSEENTANRGLLGIVGILTIIALVFAGFLFSGNRYYNGKTLKFTIDTCAVDTDSCDVVDSCAIDSIPYEQSSEHDFISFDDLLESEPKNDCHYDIRGIIEIKKALNQKGYELISTKKQDMEIEGGEIVEYIHYSYAIKTSDGDILNSIEFNSPVNGIGVDNITICFADSKDKEAFVEQIHNSNYVESDRVGEVGFVLGGKHSIEIYYNTI